MSIEIKNPAEAYAKLKRVQELANLLLIEIKEQVMAETPEDGIEILGGKLTIVGPQKNGYSFDHCQAWNDAQNRVKAIEEGMISALKHLTVYIDPETGEECPPAQPKQNRAAYLKYIF